MVAKEALVFLLLVRFSLNPAQNPSGENPARSEVNRYTGVLYAHRHDNNGEQFFTGSKYSYASPTATHVHLLYICIHHPIPSAPTVLLVVTAQRQEFAIYSQDDHYVYDYSWFETTDKLADRQGPYEYTAPGSGSSMHLLDRANSDRSGESSRIQLL